MLINIDENFEKAVSIAQNIYKKNKIFIYPTDTIYGIGGNPLNKAVIDRIHFIKKRDSNKQFIWLIDSIKTLSSYVNISDPIKENFLSKIWPNPISIILELNSKYKEKIKANNIAFRIPRNTFCLELLTKIKKPLISTSVNLHNKIPLNNKRLIIKKFGNEVEAVFHTQKGRTRLSSTIIDFTGDEPVIVREGMMNKLSIQLFNSIIHLSSNDKKVKKPC